MLQAQSHNYIYPNYAWIFYDWYQDGWWTTDVSGATLEFGDCRDSELAGSLDRAITIKLPGVSNKTTDIGTVSTCTYIILSAVSASPKKFLILARSYKLQHLIISIFFGGGH